MLNPIGGEAGPLRKGDELILLSQTCRIFRGCSHPTPPRVVPPFPGTPSRT